MMLLVLVFLGVALVNSQNIVQIPTATDLYQLSYSLDLQNSLATFEVTAKTKGWVGFGFTNVSGMVRSDIFIGGVNEDGSLYHGDYSSVSVGRPSLDAEQNWDLLEASETETETFLKFQRVFETADANDINITDSLMNLIWALGETDELAYHSFQRSSLKFNLLSATNDGWEPEPPPIPTTLAPTTQPPTNPGGEIPLGTDLLSVSYTIVGDRITFQVVANTLGYVGFGFTNTSGMIDSDIFVSGVLPDGSRYEGDHYSTRNGVPVNDPHETRQDWQLIEASESGGQTFVTFTRLLSTADLMYDVPIEDKPMGIIWALGSTDRLEYHNGNRGQTVFNLIAGA